jgi:3-oxoacyl-[acyl-carrier-protein] synthase-3
MLAGFAALVDQKLIAPGETALVLSAGGGFTWSCAVVRRPAPAGTAPASTDREASL